MNINQSIDAILRFQNGNLTDSIAGIEGKIRDLDAHAVQELCDSLQINAEFIASATKIKQLAGQINVIIHAAGILKSLPSILEPGESVKSVSLGAGNTGREFDLETNFRVAEFKFIHWQGGAETIRQNGIFKDFYQLAEHPTAKKKFLYLVGCEIPLRFFNSGRAIKSVFSRHPKLLEELSQKYGEDIQTVRDYYQQKQHEVTICDLSKWL